MAMAVGTFRTAMAVDPDGSTAYVAGIGGFGGGVTPVSLATGSTGPLIATGDATAVAITPDGKTAYAVVGSNVDPINLATGTIGAPITPGGSLYGLAVTPTGKPSTWPARPAPARWSPSTWRPTRWERRSR
jgi:DNA-binding beta-propeller fold protein YncE